MKTILGTTTVIATLVLSIGACGDDAGDGDGGSGNAGSGGSQSGAGMGGSPGMAGSSSQAGMTPGGSAGSAAGSGGSASNAGKCSPGKSIPSAFAYPDTIQNCGFEGKGELEGVEGFYRSIKLAEPIGPGDKFAFSVDISNLASGSMELWGGTGECGEAHEKLSTVTLEQGASGVRCLGAAPATGTYPYLIWVLQSAGQHGEVTLCPDVECPNP
jgi:hypothetical protein